MNSLEISYEDIEKKIPSVDDLLKIPVEDNGESMVAVEPSDNLIVSFHNSVDMLDLLGPIMYVREQVRERLEAAADIFGAADYAIKLFYGYRALEVQQKYYANALKTAMRQFPDSSDEEIRQFAHVLSAYPSVAGHPTGAAVDVTLFDKFNEEEVDMGVAVSREAYHAAGKKIYTLSPEVSSDVYHNRMFLRETMQNVGFAPFEGEFWHFSYGDREWASWYGEPKAIYDQLSLGSILK